MSNGNIESLLAKRILSEDKQALKVVVVEHGAQAGTLSNLLVKVHQVPKDEITELGPTCSEEQRDELLAKARPIVLVSAAMINHQRCVFRLPTGSNLLVAIQFMDGEVESFPIICDGSTFEFQPGWFS